jgi:Glycosyl transferase family 90
MVHYVEIHLRGDSIHCFDHGGYETRSDSIIRLAQEAFEHVKDKQIHKKLLVFTEDNPVYVQQPEILQNYEIYNQCDTRERAEHIFPDFVFDNWKQVGILNFDDTCASIHPAADQPPTIQKLFWIGAITHPNRMIFIKKTSLNPHVHAIVNNWIRQPGQTKEDTLQGNQFVSLPDHTKYQYLIDLEGNGYSGRIKILAHMNRLLFIQDRPHWDWAALQLQEGVHYVKVERDMNDFDTVFQSVLKHPEQYQHIPQQCYAFAKERLTKEMAIQRIVDIFLKKV